MGKSTQTKTNELLDTQRSQVQGDYSGPLATSKKRSDTAYDNQREMLPGLSSRYSNLADSGGFDDGEFSSMFGSAGGGGGAGDLGIDESKFSGALKGYEDYAASGGNIDAEGMRARANSVIPSFYKNLQNEATRRRLVNPYAPSFDNESAAMARQAGQQSVENVRNTELDIADKVDRNKQFGIQGLGSLHQAIQGMQQQGKISAAGINESAAGRRQSGQTALLGMRQEGRLAGLGGLQGLYSGENTDAKDYSNQQYGGIGDKTGATTGTIANRQNTTPWWQTALQAGGTAGAAYLSGGGSLLARKPRTGAN